ncbi:MAG: hypothetical protein ABSA79_12475 [Candidatus Bathyarchaeia archaeon]|jgi:hypothetical protein
MQKYWLQFQNPDLLVRNKVVLGNRVIVFGNRETAELVDGSSLGNSEGLGLKFNHPNPKLKFGPRQNLAHTLCRAIIIKTSIA